jgi:Peptidase family M1 domain
MNKKIVLFIAMTVAIIGSLMAQDKLQRYKNPQRPDSDHINHNHAARTSGGSGTGSNIDVVYHRATWRINPDSVDGGGTTVNYIKGNVAFYFKTTQINVNTISFDMNSVLNLDSIRFDNARLAAGNIARAGNIVTITLTRTLANNVLDSFIVFYKGSPPPVNIAAQGYQTISYTDPSTGFVQNITNTLSESYEDRDWWPCKADMQDKIDSMDMIVNVPWGKTGNTVFPLAKDTFWVAANGILTDSAINSVNNSRTFTFKTRYPMASYLVAVSVARYRRFYNSINLNGTIIPVAYNLLEGKSTATYTTIVNTMNKMNAVLVKFSELFGDYPFKLEKHGYYDGLAGAGGMEHQTFSAMDPAALTSIGTLVHELIHQWFGDNVTFANWNDLWLAEGMGKYGEQLAREFVSGLDATTPFAVRATATTGFRARARSITTQSVWIPNSNTVNSNTIWNTNYSSTIYNRGAMVWSMLRTAVGDSIFFNTLKQFHTDLKYKAATTDSVKNFFNRATGRDFTPFFNDYVGGSDKAVSAVGGLGHVTAQTINYRLTTDNRLLVSPAATQTKTAGSNVTYFRGPIVVRAWRTTAPIRDTTIVFFDWGAGNLSYGGKNIGIAQPGNIISVPLGFAPTNFAYDDSLKLLGTATLTAAPALETYTWLGGTSSNWNTASNWNSRGVPPTGAEVTINTNVGGFAPVLPAATTVGSLTILGNNTLNLNGQTLTINSFIRGSGTITGSPTSNIVIKHIDAGTLNFNQTNATTRSINTITLDPKTQVTVGAGQVDVHGGLVVPSSSKIFVTSANLRILKP